ncbi:MAG: hypothetical protein IKL00_10755 [Oscillospiraceae bacterium]|nr:hypothetical protein [Oscillospiraceae bacterium]
MKTRKLSELPHFGRNGVTVFWGSAGIGKSNAIMQTVSMNPESVAIFMNGELFSDYIRNDDVTINVDDSMDKDSLVSSLSVPMTTKGSRIFMNVTGSKDSVQHVIIEIMKQHPNNEYILVFNRINQDGVILKECVTENSRVFLETQYIHDVDHEIIYNADGVLFWTPSSCIKYSNSDYNIERMRATLKCGEALYISEGHEDCKVCFDRYETESATL